MVELVNQEITSSQILVIDLLHILFGCGERRLCNNLTEQGRAQTRLTELHDGLTHGLVLGNQRTDTYTALRISLGDGVHEHYVLLYALKVAGGDIRRLGIDELTVHLVGDEIEVVFLDEVANLTHLLFRIEVSRRVIGVANQNRARLRRNLLLEFLHRWQFETVLDIRLDGLDDRSGRDGKRHVVGI